MRRSKNTTLVELSLVCLVVAGCATAPPPPPTEKPGASLAALLASARAGCRMQASQAERNEAYADAQRAYALTPKEREVDLALARCAHLQADGEANGKNSEKRVLSVTEQGAEAAHKGALGSDDPEAAYLRALNLGLYVRTKGMTALGRLSELVRLLQVAGTKPEQDEGGPWRVLGLLYVRAPAWPVGPGDVDAAVDLLKRTASDYPQHPLNHLYLAEALKESGDHAGARYEIGQARALCSEERFGEWASRWRADADALAAKLK